jgi:hypothetical protein
MKRKQLTVILLGLIIVLAATASVQGTVKSTYIKKLPYKFNAKPSWAGKPDKSATSVNILNIPDGETVMGSVTVIVEAKGDFDSIELQGTSMSPVGYGDRYYATWNALSSGDTSILVEAKLTNGDTTAFDLVPVTVESDYKWAVYIEVDWIEGHYPNTDVLDYLVSYWSGFAIQVSYSVEDQAVADPMNQYDVITSSEFWGIEAGYNDGYDNAGGNPNTGVYTSSEKWMLWGTWDENVNVGGYTYVVIDRKDALGGNYVFIADAMIDAWQTEEMTKDNGKVIVACHELGHSIGILQLRGQSEKYDPDLYSIMSTMNTENALYMENNWYYSSSYWDTKNLEYYVIP